MPLTPLVHLVVEKIPVENAAVDERHGHLLVRVAPVTSDQSPSVAGRVAVGAWYGAVAVFFPVEGAGDAFAALEPVGRAEDGSHAEKEVGRHAVGRWRG